MEKLPVKICMGTGCFVKGKAILGEIDEIVQKEFASKVEIISSPCMGLCSIKWQESKAPYAKVADEIIEEATTQKVLAAIKKHLG